MKRVFSLLLLVLAACNTTPERRLNEALPGQPVVATASPTLTPAPASSSSASPSASTPAAPASAQPSLPPSPTASVAPLEVLKQGSFRNAVHVVSGKALLVKSEGKVYLRLEDFSTENGPDLYLYLVRNPSGSPKGDADFVTLGRLKGTSGNQNYELPAGTDTAAFQSATVWCQAFSVNFGYAELK
ncbi:MAG: electron transporter [Candidatus Melainabacteria bacterium HGW-Melainabacteria-1]|nr:MAG: electron transporter [Candidatus Melainabacteria bacterium HGW-Melainabacteria-1]